MWFTKPYYHFCHIDLQMCFRGAVLTDTTNRKSLTYVVASSFALFNICLYSPQVSMCQFDHPSYRLWRFFVHLCSCRGSTARPPKTRGRSLLGSARAHTSEVVLTLTPNRGAILESNHLGLLLDRQFDLLPNADLSVTHKTTARGGNFDLDAVEPYPPIAAAPLPCGSPSTCGHGPWSSWIAWMPSPVSPNWRHLCSALATPLRRPDRQMTSRAEPWILANDVPAGSESTPIPSPIPQNLCQEILHVVGRGNDFSLKALCQKILD